MQGKVTSSVIRTMDSLRIQKKVLGDKLKEAVLKGDQDVIKKVNFDLKRAEKGENRILDLYA